jgi:hypothetical protein
VNNLVNSLFSNLDIKIAHQSVHKRVQAPYAYGAYFSGKQHLASLLNPNHLCIIFTALLNLDSAAKSDIANESYVLDTNGHFGPSLNNHGFTSRRDLFIAFKDPTATDKWRTEAVPLWSVLSSDYDTMNVPLIPNVPLTVELSWQKPEFYLMQPESYTGRYRLEPTQVRHSCASSFLTFSSGHLRYRHIFTSIRPN